MTYWIGLCFLFAAGQSTLVLMLTLIAAQWYHRLPERSHFLLICGMVVSAAIPILSTFIAVHNYGWFTSNRLLMLFRLFFAPIFVQSGTLGMLFLIGTVCFLLLLIYGIFVSRRLMFHAKPFPDRESQEALLKNAAILQNMSLPILFTSENVKTPTVWCWGLHPAILLPEQFASCLTAKERDAVFLHELAHITRRDHLTAFNAIMCGIFLFWHPLYWIALRQSDLFADAACDLLVLSCGSISPDQYTETLLRLAAGEKYQQPVFQFLSRKDRIMKRINTILDFSERNAGQSVIGRFFWKFTVLTVSLLLTITLAFCQERKMEEDLSSFNPAKIKSYQVNKNVAEFPGDANFSDLSTPENAYVTFLRTYCNPNPNLGEALSKIAIPSLRSPFQKDKFLKNLSEDWSKVLLSAQILEVQIYENRAIVIAKLEGENVKSPYDCRTFENIDGKWLNAGNDRFNSVAEAAQKFQNVLQRKQDQENEQKENLKWLQEGLNKTKSIRFYTVGKRVDEFPDNNLTTPESLYAAINQVMASKDKLKIAKLQEELNLAKIAIPEREINNIVNMPDDFAQVLKTAEIKQVYIFKDSLALVIAFFDGENVRNPYDVRWCENKDNKWFNIGNDRVNSIDEAVSKLVKRCKSLPESGKRSDKNVSENKSGDEKTSSLLPLLQIDGLKAYAVNKTVADFSDEINLTTPENAHATIKHLIISKRNDKYEQMSQMTDGHPTILDREKANESQLTDEWRETFKKQNVIFEVLTVQDTLTFVWGIRQFDNLYDGNFYVKKDGQWLNCGNLQNDTLKEFAEKIQPVFLERIQQFAKSESDVQTGWTTPDNMKHTHLCIFEPVGDFKPQTPIELLNKLNNTLQNTGIVTGYFRTWVENGKLIGGICTNNAEELNNVIESISELKLLKMERLGAELFSKHIVKKQESLPSENLKKIQQSDWYKLLNQMQKNYVTWDENTFAYVYDPKNYEVGDQRDELETKWLTLLEEKEPKHTERVKLKLHPYDEAIFGLATIQSKKATPLLVKIAAERVMKDNAHRHFATKALGILGNKTAIPELIPLLYHFNFNTRWDAQIALVRLTGENFGRDAEAWGKWYNENREKLGKDFPVFDPKPVDWTFGNDNKELKFYSDPKNQAESDTKQLGNE
jgi:beta-lactamase regulating signal transducer with metallopeptidase domain